MMTILRRINILYFMPVIFVGFFLAIFAVMRAGVSSPDNTHPLVGKKAPALITAPLSADSGAFAPIKEGVLQEKGVKIVNFWASWCVPCRIEHPQLLSLQARSLKIYGVSYLDRPQNARKYLTQYANPYAGVGDDEGRKTALEWGVRGVPETYIIDAKGRVIWVFSGPITAEILEKRMRPILEKAQAD